MKRLGLLAGALVLVLAGGGAYAVGGLGGAATVTVAAAAQGDVVSRVVASGLVEPSRQEDVSTRVAGVLEWFDLKEGQAVKQGQELGRMSRTPFETALADARGRLLAQQAQLAQMQRRDNLSGSVAAVQLDAAEQKLNLAKSQLTDREVGAQRGVSEAAFGIAQVKAQLVKSPVSELLLSQLDHAQETLKNAQTDLERLAAPDHPARLQIALAAADLKAAQVNIEASAVLPQDLIAQQGAVAAAAQAVTKAEEDLANTSVKAPFDGVVLQVYAKQGAGVAAGTPLITLAALDTAKVAATVDEADISRVAVGSAATVTSPSNPAWKFQGKVTAVAPRATKDTSNTTVVRTEVEFKNEGAVMRSGMNADVEIDVASRTGVLRVPLTALRGTGMEQFVFVLEGDHVRKLPVTAGVKDTAWTEITAGLKVGDQVVTAPESVLKSLQDGQAVRARGQN
jgi:HlyD family secretion protein